MSSSDETTGTGEKHEPVQDGYRDHCGTCWRGVEVSAPPGEVRYLVSRAPWPCEVARLRDEREALQMTHEACISAEDLERARRDITARGMLLSRQDSLSLIHEIEHLKRVVGTGRALCDAQAEQVGDLISERNELRSLLADRSPLFQDLEDAKAENARLRERVAALEAACYEAEVEGGPRSFSGFFCRLCGWDCSPDFKAEHEPSCVLYEADAALAQADDGGRA